MNYREASQKLTLDEAVAQWLETRATLKLLQEAEYYLGLQIIGEIEGRGATEARTDAGVVTLATKSTYDPGKLAALREITDPRDLDGVYAPEHEETITVKEKWNMTRGRALARLGAEHQRIIEEARIPGRPTISVEEDK